MDKKFRTKNSSKTASAYVLTVIKEVLFLEDWILGSISTQFWYFPDIS